MSANGDVAVEPVNGTEPRKELVEEIKKPLEHVSNGGDSKDETAIPAAEVSLSLIILHVVENSGILSINVRNIGTKHST